MVLRLAFGWLPVASVSLIASLSVTGCSSNDAAPLAPTAASGDAATLFSQPVDSGGAVAPIVPYDAGVSAYDAGPIVVADAAPAGDAGTIPCVPGGELEVEPNDPATPNVLSGYRCGVVMPGEEDVLQVNLQAFNLQWQGAIGVTLSQTAVGGPYLVHITSQTPSVPTYWVLGFK